MQRLDRIYITLGLCWVIAGMVYGAWLGASHHNNFANSHAHINLLGFVSSILFGMLFWAFPAMARARAAFWQMVVYQAGVVVLVIGKIIVDNDGTETFLLPVGAVAVIVGTAMMLYLFTTSTSDAKA